MRFKSMRSSAPSFAIPIIFFTLIASPASADCTRHLYNRSLDVWAYGFTASSAADLNSEAPRILPGETKTIEYETDASNSSEKWLMVEQITEVSGKPEYKQSFQVEGCYLRHDGVTGRAVLNDPADGDVIFID